MSFNNAGTPVWLAPGGTLAWPYGFNNNSDALYAMANCLTPNGLLQTIWQGEELNDDGTVTYWVAFTNIGPNWVRHNLNGGGLT